MKEPAMPRPAGFFMGAREGLTQVDQGCLAVYFVNSFNKE